MNVNGSKLAHLFLCLGEIKKKKKKKKYFGRSNVIVNYKYNVHETKYILLPKLRTLEKNKNRKMTVFFFQYLTRIGSPINPEINK